MDRESPITPSEELLKRELPNIVVAANLMLSLIDQRKATFANFSDLAVLMRTAAIYCEGAMQGEWRVRRVE